MGNCTTLETVPGGVSDSTSYVYDGGDRIATVDGVPYAYDNRGNLTSDGTWTYSYDGAGRMVRAEKEGSVYTYTYNGDGLLVAESIDGAETVFTWDLALDVPQVLATSDGAKNLYGLERIGVEQGGGWRYTLADALGSVRQWTDPAGGVLGVQSYGPFGEPREPVGTPPWGFTGEWQDPAGMVYLRARWYNPALGRFSQVDPVAGDLMVPATQHAYAYALNSPLMHSDPSGKIVFAALVFAAFLGEWYTAGYSVEVLGQVDAFAKKNDMGFFEAYGHLLLHPSTAMHWMDVQSCQQVGWDAAQAATDVLALATAGFLIIQGAIDALRDGAQSIDDLLHWDSYPQSPSVLSQNRP